MKKEENKKIFGRIWRNERRKKVAALNTFTSGRIIIVPVLVAMLIPDKSWLNYIALAIYIPFAFSDLLDGYIARRFGMTNSIGRFLDPVADKIFVVALTYCLVVFRDLHWLTEIAALAIILREVVIPALRGFLESSGVPLDVSRLAKWKTVLQMIAIGSLILPQKILPLWLGIGLAEWLLLFAVILTLVTAYKYLAVAYTYIKEVSK